MKLAAGIAAAGLAAAPPPGALSDEQRRAQIEAPSRMCGLVAGKAADELARLRAAPDTGEIVELEDVINIGQNGFERWWTFTKPNHRAYPAFVCSWPRERDGQFDMGMDGRCGLDSDRCLEFFRDMKLRNAALVQEIRALRNERK